MKCELEVRVCDSCSTRHEYDKRSMKTGCHPFQGWIDMTIFGVHGPGFSSGSDDMTGDKTFCSVLCALKYLNDMILKEKEKVVVRETLATRKLFQRNEE
jgi:hypothetical protein